MAHGEHSGRPLRAKVGAGDPGPVPRGRRVVMVQAARKDRGERRASGTPAGRATWPVAGAPRRIPAFFPAAAHPGHGRGRKCLAGGSLSDGRRFCARNPGLRAPWRGIGRRAGSRAPAWPWPRGVLPRPCGERERPRAAGRLGRGAGESLLPCGPLRRECPAALILRGAAIGRVAKRCRDGAGQARRGRPGIHVPRPGGVPPSRLASRLRIMASSSRLILSRISSAAA